MQRQRFEELKHTGHLPSPSGVGMRILVLTQEEDCSLDEIARTIQADPALTGRILKLASSVSRNGSGSPVATAREAAMRLGLRAVTNVALGFTLVTGNRTGRCPAFDYEGYWSWSLAAAVAAQHLSAQLGLGVPAEAFTCGLLAHVGRLALASVHPTDYAVILERLEHEPGELERLEREVLSLDNREIAGALLEDWGLPREMSDAVRGLRVPGAAEALDGAAAAQLRLLEAACVIADACVEHTDTQPRHLGPLEVAAGVLGVEPADFREAFDRIVPLWKQWGAMLQVSTNEVLPFEELERRGRPAAVRPAPFPVEDDGRLRILAVDDDPTSLKILVRHLEREGHRVFTAKHGREALAMAARVEPQVVVTDWIMPHMDGLELCKALRRAEQYKNLFILILTGRSEEDRIVEALNAGANDYVEKPFRPRVLLARIGNAERLVRMQEERDRSLQAEREQQTKLAAQARRLQMAADTDALTGIRNRRFAMQRLETEWANSDRSGMPLSVIMMDIDHFKSINDNFGHAAGDEVLRATTRVIESTLRRGDTCARIGGEEFLVICPNTGEEGALHLAERIREEVEGNTITSGGMGGNITLSLGVAMRDASVRTTDELLRLADEAVYEAKRRGRNHVVAASVDGRRRTA